MLEFSTVSSPAVLPDRMMRLTASMAVSLAEGSAISSRSVLFAASFLRSAMALL
jgi:hypothetical protein